MSLRRVGVVTALVVAVAGIGTDAQRFGGRSPVPVPAVAAVLRLFEASPAKTDGCHAFHGGEFRTEGQISAYALNRHSSSRAPAIR